MPATCLIVPGEARLESALTPVVTPGERLQRVSSIWQTGWKQVDIYSAPTPPANLSLFISIGLVDKDFGEKQALAAWDNPFARRRTW